MVGLSMAQTKMDRDGCQIICSAHRTKAEKGGGDKSKRQVDRDGNRSRSRGGGDSLALAPTRFRSKV